LTGNREPAFDQEQNQRGACFRLGHGDPLDVELSLNGEDPLAIHRVRQPPGDLVTTRNALRGRFAAMRQLPQVA
jgi:hypothetical protein